MWGDATSRRGATLRRYGRGHSTQLVTAVALTWSVGCGCSGIDDHPDYVSSCIEDTCGEGTGTGPIGRGRFAGPGVPALFPPASGVSPSGGAGGTGGTGGEGTGGSRVSGVGGLPPAEIEGTGGDQFDDPTFGDDPDDFAANPVNANQPGPIDPDPVAEQEAAEEAEVGAVEETALTDPDATTFRNSGLGSFVGVSTAVTTPSSTDDAAGVQGSLSGGTDVGVSNSISAPSSGPGTTPGGGSVGVETATGTNGTGDTIDDDGGDVGVEPAI